MQRNTSPPVFRRGVLENIAKRCFQAGVVGLRRTSNIKIGVVNTRRTDSSNKKRILGSLVATTMRENQIKNIGYLKDRRRELRNNLTPAEATLWNELKSGKLADRKFRRQHSIANYIVDFYCPAEKLIVELDGEVHNDAMQSVRDFERDERLKALGNRIIRFENKQMFKDMEGVLRVIADNFRE